MVKVSRHTFIMTPRINAVKYSPSFWLSILVRKYGVILDRSRVTAPGVTRTKKWSHIWDHSTKAVNPSQSAVEKIYERATTHPCPTGIVHLARKHWHNSFLTAVYGDSYLAPTPNEWTLQQIGILITKAFILHLRCSGLSVAINTRRTSQRIPRQYGRPPDDRLPPGFATANSVPALLQ